MAHMNRSSSNASGGTSPPSRQSGRNPWPQAAVILLTLATTASAAKPSITAGVFAPDGKSVIMGSQAGLEILAWPSLQPGRELATQNQHIHDLGFSPDSQHLLVAGGTPAEKGIVEIFSWPACKLLHRIADQDDLVYSVDWHPNGSTFVLASLDGTVTLYNATTYQPVRQFTGHSRGVTAARFLATDDMIVTAGLDESVRVWNINKSTHLRTLNNHTNAVHGLAIQTPAPRIPVVFSISEDRTVRLWQPTIGRMVRFLRLPVVPISATWLPDNKHLAVGTTDGHVRVIDPATLQIQHDTRAIDGWPYCLVAHPTDGSLLVGGSHGQVKRVPWMKAKPR